MPYGNGTINPKNIPKAIPIMVPVIIHKVILPHVGAMMRSNNIPRKRPDIHPIILPIDSMPSPI
jgi:hypothetical protein